MPGRPGEVLVMLYLSDTNMLKSPYDQRSKGRYQDGACFGQRSRQIGRRI